MKSIEDLENLAVSKGFTLLFDKIQQYKVSKESRHEEVVTAKATKSQAKKLRQQALELGAKVVTTVPHCNPPKLKDGEYARFVTIIVKDSK